MKKQPQTKSIQNYVGTSPEYEYVYVNMCVFVSILTGLQVTNQAAAPEVRPQTRPDAATMPTPLFQT